MFETIKNGKNLIAIILRREYESSAINFFTPDDFSQQLAYMNRPAGYVISPHIHNRVPREVFYTQEVLFVKSGKVKVDLYDDKRCYIQSITLEKGDVILLASGGHGFEMLEQSEIIEVKQGPYAGEGDKTRFKGITSEKAKVISLEARKDAGKRLLKKSRTQHP